MSKIVLFCREAPGLTLGPNADIQFRGGFAEIDAARLDEVQKWIDHSGTPFIRQVKGGMPTDNEIRCPVCGDSQADAAALSKHYGGEHQPKAVPLQPADQRTLVVHEVGGEPVLVQTPQEPLPGPEAKIILPKGGKTLIAQSAEVSTPAGAPATTGTSSQNVKAPVRSKAAKGGGTQSGPTKAAASGPTATRVATEGTKTASERSGK